MEANCFLSEKIPFYNVMLTKLSPLNVYYFSLIRLPIIEMITSFQKED